MGQTFSWVLKRSRWQVAGPRVSTKGPTSWTEKSMPGAQCPEEAFRAAGQESRLSCASLNNQGTTTSEPQGSVVVGDHLFLLATQLA